MALYCIVSRRACSRFIVQGVEIVPESRLGRHLAGCPGCRDFAASLSELSGDLSALIRVPHPSAQFVEPVWERVKPQRKPAPSGRLGLIGAAACGLACGWAVWRVTARTADPRTAPLIAAAGHVKHAPLQEPRVQPTRPEPAEDGGGKDYAVADASPGSRHTSNVSWTRVHGTRRMTGQYALRRTRKNSLVAWPRQSTAPIDLRASGLLLESQGDPGLANVAYQAEFRQHPSDDTAFDMGRSAEESGDMEQAMDVYAGLLESADAKSRAQKGWTP